MNFILIISDKIHGRTLIITDFGYYKNIKI